MAATEEICPNIDAPPSGVWADPVLLHPTAVPMDPMAMPRDPTAMLGPTAVASSSSSKSRAAAFPAVVAGADNSRDVFNMFAPILTLCLESSDQDHTRDDSSLWRWMICYARFQCAAQLLIDTLADGPAGVPDIEICFQACQRTLNAMSSAAPRGNLEDCRTKKGATWQKYRSFLLLVL